MIVKYGKPVDMRRINRNLDGIKKAIEFSHGAADKYYKPAEIEATMKCRICSSLIHTEIQGGGVFVSAWNKYDYYQCQNCEAIVLANLPDVEKMYSGKSDSVNTYSYIDDKVYNQRVEMISGPKVEFALEACEHENITIGQWLDIGCGGGEILSYINNNNKGISAIGIESDVNEVEFAHKRNLKVYNTYVDVNVENEMLKELIAKSDIISMFNVLEHIENPVALVEYLWKNMHSDAIIMFEVPRHPSVASFANQTANCMIYRHIVPPIHLQIFSEKSLNYLISGKFNIFAKWYFGQGYTDIINNAMLSSGLKESPLYLELIKLSNKIQQIFDESNLADQMIIMAKKI